MGQHTFKNYLGGQELSFNLVDVSGHRISMESLERNQICSVRQHHDIQQNGETAWESPMPPVL